MNGSIRDIRRGDAPRVCELYNHYILNSTASFEEEAVPSPEMAKRIDEVTTRFPWYVYEEDGRVLGFAYAGVFKSRSAYRFTAETTVYLDKDAHGRGIGTALYRRLLDSLRDMQLHAAIACIALPNEKSQALHEKLGYKKIAHFEQVGFKFGTWIDLGYWELLL